MKRKITTIIAIKGRADLGKTETIKTIYNLLILKYPNAKSEHELDNNEIRVILTISGIKIGIESNGDPDLRLFKSIRYLWKINVI